MPSPEQLAGPTGAIVALVAVLAMSVAVIKVLWQQHLKADQDDRDQRDLAQKLLGISLQNNADAVAAWNRRNEQEAARQRRNDR